ncbi:MAG TPA: hypothetical protein PKY71_06225 [Smithellaceae bacterium]|nr:hypothetical protein [Smithellaceae bacterium]
MDIEDRKKCSELWQMASGDYIAPEYWTEEAADELAQYIHSAAIAECMY